MENVQHILTDSIVAKFLATHQGAAEAINSAARELAYEADAIPALRKLLPALGDKVVRVFFSYKKKDEIAAKRIVDLLRVNSAGKLRIKYQADFTKEITGKKWRDEIQGVIAEADWFILLLPDPNDDWDWCLFETGLFEAQRKSGDRLICLHHPDTKVPTQIDGYHAVPAAIPDVEQFLNMVYVRENPVPGMRAINPDLKDYLPTLAEQIVSAIRPPRKPLSRRIFEPWLELKIEDAKALSTMDDLDRSVIVNANQEALDLFEYIETPHTWGELRSGLPKGPEDSRWREELFHVVRRIAGGRKFYPIQAVFPTKTGKVYRPVACAIDRLGDDKGAIETYHITFTEDVAAVDHSKMPPNLTALATVLRFAFRFRWEVLEKFSGTAMTEADVDRLDIAFRRLQVEWASRGGGDQAAVEGLFPDDNSRNRIKKIYADWASIRNPAGTGELDLAIEKKDVNLVQKCLKRAIPLNQEFLEMATDVFSSLIHHGSQAEAEIA
jgi:hypothetical protein